MGNKQPKYSIIGEKNIEMIGEIINDTGSTENQHIPYDMKTIVKNIMSKKILTDYNEITKSIQSNFIHRSELKIIYDTLLQTNDFEVIFPHNLIMFRLDIKGIIITVAKINDEYELREYTVDTQNYTNNQIFVTHLIPFLPYET